MSLTEALAAFPESAALPAFDEKFGAGHFGRWGVDTAGDPVFHYEPVHGVAGDHWHLLGNDTLSCTAHSGGYVQIYDWTRGGKLLNRWHPASRNFAGGFHWILVDGNVCCTLREYLPVDAAQSVCFGLGYVERITEWRGLSIVERISVPQGKAAQCHVLVTLTDRKERARSVQVVAYWSANLHQLTVAPIMTYGSERLYDAWRRRLNRRWRIKAGYDDASQGLVARYVSVRRPRKSREARALIDAHPPALAIASTSAHPVPTMGCIDPAAFFGAGGVAAPEGLSAAPTLSLRSGSAYDGMPMLLHWRIELAPSAEAEVGCAVSVLHGAEVPSPQKSGACYPTLELVVPEAPEVARELRWHAYYLQAGAYYSEYFDAHFIDQGSAYSYMQGASGAPRDFALFILPLIPVRPDLAKDMLRFVLRLQRGKDGGFPYATFGHGVASGGGVHSWSSDLDLFILWALSEYVGLTRDFDFLDEELTYYPKEDGQRDTVGVHARRALLHLRDHVGTGRNGIFRAGTGDWNDVLLAFSRCPPWTAWKGESALNEGLAAVVLPLAAEVLGTRDPEFASIVTAMTAAGQRFARNIDRLWTGAWLARGYLGYGAARLGEDRLFLDAQGFPVIAGLHSPERRATLFENIHAHCVARQPAGASCLVPPMRGLLLHPGSDTNGGTWAAIDAWLSWAWSHEDPEAAWRFYRSTLLAARAEAYPDVWYGVWSGPDSYNAHYHEKPGETFDFNATPMAKYPVMNMNRHAGPMLAALKMVGIQAQADGIGIAPRLPFDRFVLRTPLLGVAYTPDSVQGYYAPTGQAEDGVVLRVRVPRGRCASDWIAECHGTPCAVTTDGDQVCFRVQPLRPGARMEWRLLPRPDTAQTDH